MRPILFHLGPLPIYTFGFLIALGVFISLQWMAQRARKMGFPPGDTAFDMVFITVVVGFLSAQFYYVLQNFDGYRDQPLKIFALWEGGLIFYGGVFGSFLGLWGFLRWKKIPFSKGLDFILPYVALTHAFGRLGCFFNGCCYGKACDLPWATAVPGVAGKVHPTQLYEAFLDLMLFLFLNNRYPKKRFDGEVAALHFAFYAMIRFTVEIFRAEPIFAAGLTRNQWISLAVFIGAAFFYFKNTSKLKQSA